jgi:hypothetical protein
MSNDAAAPLSNDAAAPPDAILPSGYDRSGPEKVPDT